MAGNTNVPYAIGDPQGVPQGFRSTASPDSLPQKMLADLDQLAKNLAPNPIMFQVQVNLAPGQSQQVQLSSLTNGFNSILNCLVSGLVNMYWGGINPSIPPAIPDMQFNASTNPVMVPFPVRSDRIVYIVNPANAAGTVTGNLYFNLY